MSNNIRKWDEVNGLSESEERMTTFLDRQTDGYAILQLRRTDETAYERFESYANLKRQGKEPDYDHYEVVYTGGLPVNLYGQDTLNLALEGLYEGFNVDYLIPEDFTGHSVSVSDIIALKIGGVVSCHYVDSIGFQELPDFLNKSNYLRSAEMAMEDDYNSIDGIINNGPKEEPAGRKSVLEELKEKTAAEPALPRPKKPEEHEL